jgi:hypothetical protein
MEGLLSYDEGGDKPTSDVEGTAIGGGDRGRDTFFGAKFYSNRLTYFLQPPGIHPCATKNELFEAAFTCLFHTLRHFIPGHKVFGDPSPDHAGSADALFLMESSQVLQADLVMR